MSKGIAPFLGLRAGSGGVPPDTALVALQHLLPSIEGLFARLVEAGFRAGNIHVVGKPYSTVGRVAASLRLSGIDVFEEDGAGFQAGHYGEYFDHHVARFWRHVTARLGAGIRRVVVLDEGGWLCRQMPADLAEQFTVTAVEHTMFGLFTPATDRAVPVVLMAASAAKTRFESRIIADSIVGRLDECVPDLVHREVGIIGLGNLGQAVAGHLQQRGVAAIAGFDKDAEKARELGFVRRPRSLVQLAEECQVLVGCSGRNTLRPESALHELGGLRWLASGSSADIEFHAVAEMLARRSTLRTNPFADARGEVCGSDVVLLNGGFPINFDRLTEREDPVRIQLTRELSFASVLQAALCVDAHDGTEAIMLDPHVQQLLVQAWLDQTAAASLFPKWQPHGDDWWQKHSLGRLGHRSLAEHLVLLR